MENIIAIKEGVMVVRRRYHQIRIPNDGKGCTEQVVCYGQEEVDVVVKRLLEDNCSVFIWREWAAIRDVYVVEGFPLP